jgi:hypothetical protein
MRMGSSWTMVVSSPSLTETRLPSERSERLVVPATGAVTVE